jgi:probable F420-dependent oxidoreductase
VAASFHTSTATHTLCSSHLTAATEATSALRIGSRICLVIQRDPIVTANEVASLDHLSGGRFDFGVGAGWNREKMRNHGTGLRTRMRSMAERVEAMKTIWSQDEASYDGEFVNFGRIWSWPKPVQRPHPPVLVGGNGASVPDRVLAFGDGWCRTVGRMAAASSRGRPRFERTSRWVELMVMGVPPDPDALERLRVAGCRRVVHWLPSSALALG